MSTILVGTADSKETSSTGLIISLTFAGIIILVGIVRCYATNGKEPTANHDLAQTVDDSFPRLQLELAVHDATVDHQAPRVHSFLSLPEVPRKFDVATMDHHAQSIDDSVSLPKVLRMFDMAIVDPHDRRHHNTVPSPMLLQEEEVNAVTVERFLSDMAREKPIRFSPKQLEGFSSNYSRKLGSGGFGVVYKGEFPNGVQVAVKVLNNSAGEGVKEQFMAEVSIIGRTYHKNLVRLYGFCFDAKVKALVYEYMENGSLDAILFSKNHSIEWEKLYEIGIGTAKGLAYLHEECQQRIIHYDIKPGNVLLDSNFSPKLADFGLAKLCNRENSHVTMTGGRGTPGYAAPELWMPFPVTYKCDVYSFGMMLFEILGKRKNLNITMSESQQWFPRQVWEKFEKGELEELMVDCNIEEKDREKAKIMCMVALWCAQYLPEARPSMSSVVKILEGGAEVMTPPNPFKHLISSSVDLAVCMEISGDSTRTGGNFEANNKDSTLVMKKYEIEMASSS